MEINSIEEGIEKLENSRGPLDVNELYNKVKMQSDNLYIVVHSMKNSS